MKTFYNKILFLKVLKLPALLFFLLALSYNVKAQKVEPNPICFGGDIKLFCDDLTGCGLPGSTYTWQDLTGWVSDELNPVIHPSDPVGYHSGKFYLSVQYPGGQSSGTVFVQFLRAIFVTGVVTPIGCNGMNDGAITLNVSGGSGIYTNFIWSSGQTTQNIAGLSAGTYTCTVTDDAGCSQASAAFTLTNPAGKTITKTGGSNVSCYGYNDGSISISVSGGTTPYNYTWNPSKPNSPDITGLAPGDYYVTVTDASGCPTVGGPYSISQPASIVILSDKHDVTCSGSSNGYINLTVSGGASGYNYAWSSGTSTGPTITGLSIGTYTVTVSDVNNCKKTDSWQIFQSSALSLTPTVTQPFCVGNTGSITVTMSGGLSPYTYVWSNGHTTTGATDGISGLTAGTYTVSVKDVNSCPASQSWTILAPVPLTISTLTKADPGCSASNDGVITISVTGGATSYSYLWSNTKTTPSITGLSGGTYTVTVTDGHS